MSFSHKGLYERKKLRSQGLAHPFDLCICPRNLTFFDQVIGVRTADVRQCFGIPNNVCPEPSEP
jgi:hypothetical protein